ncbi:LolA family protein [Nitrogeniibacter aestuarii]|uniref:LolA family protein n=1 Tax=Nitrogeniibacter aestuarii TaxID=2815343 RepID=UPI001E52B6AD|nr:outer membrane lipoprotein carrier protein LolA [Nitrogeniibacter aestuarii]
MTRRPHVSVALLLFCLSWLWVASPVRAAPWGLDTLMAALADNPGGTAQFVERKYLAVLDVPIESSGTLVYKRPGRLERHTERPRAESMVLDGSALTLSRASGDLHMDLRDYPDAAALIESIRSTLAGDRSALEKNYLLSLSGTSNAWTLDLSPSDPQITALVHRIRINGHAGLIDSVEILQADGDRSVMLITPLSQDAS